MRWPSAPQPAALLQNTPAFSAPLPQRHRIVLDTNAVLDAWLFRDPCMAGVVQALEEGQLTWTATAAMRDELAHTLMKSVLKEWHHESSSTLSQFDLKATISNAPDRTPHRQLWCSDNDDQKFIDLALAEGARWLLSKDRAVLRLARPARKLGLEILPPGRWRLSAS